MEKRIIEDQFTCSVCCPYRGIIKCSLYQERLGGELRTNKRCNSCKKDERAPLENEMEDLKWVQNYNLKDMN